MTSNQENEDKKKDGQNNEDQEKKKDQVPPNEPNKEQSSGPLGAIGLTQAFSGAREAPPNGLSRA